MSYLKPTKRAYLALGRRRDPDRLFRAIVITMCALVTSCIGIAIYLGIKDHSARAACRDRGGSVEEYNCHEVLMPVSCGSNCTMYVPSETCDWRCVGERAEADPYKP